MSSRRVHSALISFVLVSAACVVGAGSAAGSPGKPGVPAHEHVSSATTTSFTVSFDRAAHAKRYVVYASKEISDVSFANLNKKRPGRHQAASTKTSITIKGLHNSTDKYFYRVVAYNGSKLTLGDILEGYSAPKKPTGVKLTTPLGKGIALEWTPVDSLGYQIERGTDRTLTKHRTFDTVTGPTAEFTPYGLQKGTGYYLRVRANNGSSHSGWSPVQFGRFDGNELNVQVLTYNVLHMQFDGGRDSNFPDSEIIAPWVSKRSYKAAALIKSADPDVVSINEASDWTHGDGSPRQVDILGTRLGDNYSMADCDGRGGRFINPRTGNYIFYRKNVFRALNVYTVGAEHDQYDLSSQNWMCAAKLINVKTSAKFLFVSVHLAPGQTAGQDRVRGGEAKNLWTEATRLAGDLPIIVAGDFNSYGGPGDHVIDSPGDFLRSKSFSDARVSAQSFVNREYGSVNGYARTAPKTGRIIDHVVGSPGVAMRTWKQVLKLKRGKFIGPIPSDHNPVTVGVTVQY